MTCRNSRRQVITAAWLVLGLGCADSGSTLDDAVGGEDQALQQDDDVTQVAIDAQRELAPTWVKSVPVATPDYDLADFRAGMRSYSRLVTDYDRHLWLFSITKRNRLQLSQLDDQAQVIERVGVPEPANLPRSSKPPVIFKNYTGIWQADTEPALKMTWRECESLADCSDQVDEKLIWSGDDIREEPVRTRLTPEVFDVLRDGNGDVYTVRGAMTVSLAKTSGDDGRSLWRRDDLGQFDFNFVTGASLGDDHVALNVMDAAFTTHRIQILDRAGKLQIAGPKTFGSANDSLALLGANDQPVVVGRYDDASTKMFIWRLRAGSEQVSGVELQNASTLLAVAADPSGNVYVNTRSGDNNVLCRVSTGNRARCVTLPAYVNSQNKEELFVDELVARDRGELYVRSGDHLLRFDFPRDRR